MPEILDPIVSVELEISLSLAMWRSVETFTPEKAFYAGVWDFDRPWKLLRGYLDEWGVKDLQSFTVGSPDEDQGVCTDFKERIRYKAILAMPESEVSKLVDTNQIKRILQIE